MTRRDLVLQILNIQNVPARYLERPGFLNILVRDLAEIRRLPDANDIGDVLREHCVPDDADFDLLRDELVDELGKFDIKELYERNHP
jgi:hypothetical protein